MGADNRFIRVIAETERRKAVRHARRLEEMRDPRRRDLPEDLEEIESLMKRKPRDEAAE